jgi:hypothetical protein
VPDLKLRPELAAHAHIQAIKERDDLAGVLGAGRRWMPLEFCRNRLAVSPVNDAILRP